MRKRAQGAGRSFRQRCSGAACGMRLPGSWPLTCMQLHVCGVVQVCAGGRGAGKSGQLRQAAGLQHTLQEEQTPAFTPQQLPGLFHKAHTRTCAHALPKIGRQAGRAAPPPAWHPPLLPLLLLLLLLLLPLLLLLSLLLLLLDLLLLPPHRQAAADPARAAGAAARCRPLPPAAAPPPPPWPAWRTAAPWVGVGVGPGSLDPNQGPTWSCTGGGPSGAAALSLPGCRRGLDGPMAVNARVGRAMHAGIVTSGGLHGTAQQHKVESASSVAPSANSASEGRSQAHGSRGPAAESQSHLPVALPAAPLPARPAPGKLALQVDPLGGGRDSWPTPLRVMKDSCGAQPEAEQPNSAATSSGESTTSYDPLSDYFVRHKVRGSALRVDGGAVVAPARPAAEPRTSPLPRPRPAAAHQAGHAGGSGCQV